MTRFIQRGGAWVLGQSVLLGALVLLAVMFRHGGFPVGVMVAGALLGVLGLGILLAGAVALGNNLTPFPKPAQRAQLVRHGIYARVRHPLYTGVIAVSLGWALVWQSWPALLVAALLVPFFHAKARHEERWLREKFTDYADYEKRVSRFIPWKRS
jgi:protein-S-isoprenylcysteine O-methyltransferase Ste14